MKDPNNKILFDIVNNTDKDQVINLFDNGDPTSGGKFTTPQRIIKYDLSSYSFPNTILTKVISNYNSNEYPINYSQLFFPGDLTNMSVLVAYLNTLGIGPFVNEGGNIANATPNYPMVSDNGGLYGVELNLEPLVSYTFSIENGTTLPPPAGPMTGTTNYQVNDLTDSELNRSLNIAAGGAGSANAEGVSGVPNNTQVVVSGTAISTWELTISINGISIQTFGPNAAGPVNVVSTPFTISQGDSLDILMAKA